MTNPLSILQVSTSDLAGGAERSARNLFEAYRRLGHESWLAVGYKRTDDPRIIRIPNDEARNAWVRACDRALARYERGTSRVKGIGTALRIARDAGQPFREVHRQLGMDDFDFPATRLLPELPPRVPDLIHFHNLHGGYFDLRCLPDISHRIPSVLNLRDAWLISGHCAFSFDCERWRTGCGCCPDLSIFPSVKRDATAQNWEQKRKILAKSRLYVTTPSKWLMDRIEASIVAPSMVGKRVIPNGVDTDVFCWGSKAAARMALDLPQDALVLLTAANGIRHNRWKDYETLRDAIGVLGRAERSKKIVVLAIGETSPSEMVGDTLIRFVPFQDDSAKLAEYYRAADLYLHAAKVESFGNVLVEARACGTPVVVTAVGGIPEHVKGVAWDHAPSAFRVFDAKEATGALTLAGDAESFAHAISFLLGKPELREQMRRNCVRDVATHYSLSIQATTFLEWYTEILSEKSRPNGGDNV